MKTLLLLFACLQDPDALIRDLSSDDLDVRDAAVTGLVKLGEPVLEPMKKALAKADGEAKARLQDVIATIERDERRKKFKGGAEVCGLAAALRSEKDAYKAGDAITLKLEIMNVTKVAKPYVPATHFDTRAPGRSATTTSSYGRITVTQLSGEAPTDHEGLRGCGMGPLKKAIELKSGESVTLDIALGEKLPAGEFEVAVSYYAKTKQLLDGAEADLVSNIVKFKIEK